MLNSENSGFTIIETLIVLIIAAIMLILVFQIIPSLERSSRNTARKDDVSTLLNAIGQYELDNSGNFPQSCGGVNPCDSSDSNTSYPNDYFLRYFKARLNFYTISDINLTLQTISGSTARTIQSPNTNNNTVQIYNYEICDQNSDGGSTIYGAGYSDVVALYNVETNDNVYAPVCQQL